MASDGRVMKSWKRGGVSGARINHGMPRATCIGRRTARFAEFLDLGRSEHKDADVVVHLQRMTRVCLSTDQYPQNKSAPHPPRDRDSHKP